MTPDRATRLTDAASLRVLAHPTRLRLLGLLRQHGPQTAAHLGDRVDEAPGTISYHLGKLASIALIEEAPGTGTDRRERWWRATSELTTWEPADALDDPATAAASTAMQRTIAHLYAANYDRYLETVPALPREWVAAAASGDRTLRLTAAELAELRAELEALTERWRAVGEGRTAAPDTGTDPSAGTDTPAERVTLVYQAYRSPEA